MPANSVGTGLGNTDVSFYTLANTPTAPTVNNPTAGTLDVDDRRGRRQPREYHLRDQGGGRPVCADERRAERLGRLSRRPLPGPLPRRLVG